MGRPGIDYCTSLADWTTVPDKPFLSKCFTQTSNKTAAIAMHNRNHLLFQAVQPTEPSSYIGCSACPGKL